jgi:hypothetical protein
MVQEGLAEYKKDVESGTFPGTEYSPYTMKDEERKAFEMLLAKDAAERKSKHEKVAKGITDHDEYEKLHLYGPNNYEIRTPEIGIKGPGVESKRAARPQLVVEANHLVDGLLSI